MANRAVQLSGGREPAALMLAAAYAETGQFPKAIEIAEQGLTVADAQSNDALADALLERIKLYQAGAAHRDALVVTRGSKS